MIKGWDVAVGSMSVGEKARFILAPNYAYGDKGVGAIVGPNCELEIEMKVYRYTSYICIKPSSSML
jgi:FKBP-type peptidyl-prolyl cis-trans isomerase